MKAINILIKLLMDNLKSRNGILPFQSLPFNQLSIYIPL